MQLGFVSAILADLCLEEVLAFAAEEEFACVELMCWPPGRADRRYAGVTHVDVGQCAADEDHLHHVRDLLHIHAVSVSALGYYPNPLDPDPEHRRVVIDHLKAVIDVAPKLGVGVVNTFIGRDPQRPAEANWPLVRQVWPDLLRFAAERGVTVGVENCPMLYSADEWPGGKNLAVSPEAWRRLFAEAGYRGAVCIEVEDRAYEGSLEDRKRSLRQSKRFLEQFT